MTLSKTIFCSLYILKKACNEGEKKTAFIKTRNCQMVNFERKNKNNFSMN